MRNRIIYNNVGLLTGPSPAFQVHSGTNGESKLTSLNLVQTSSFDMALNRADVKQIGGTRLAARQAVTQPSVSLGFSYLLTDGINEKTLGFNVAGETSFLSGVTGNDDRNFFLFVSENAQTDFNLQSGFSNMDVLSFGNCYVNNYSLEASVGTFPSVSVDYSACNVRFDQTSGTNTRLYHPLDSTEHIIASGIIPAINRENGTLAQDAQQAGLSEGYGYTVARDSASLSLDGWVWDGGIFNTGDTKYLAPGDIELMLSNPNIGGIRLSGDLKMHVQSVAISIPINRTDLMGFGSKYVYDRRAEYPTLGQMQISATANHIVTGHSHAIFSKDDDYQMEILFKKGTTDNVLTKFQDAKIVSESISQSIGSNMSFDATFSFECSPTKGFLFSGLAADVGD